LTPAETALRRLDEAADLLNQADAEEFSLEIADTVRTYLVARFDLAALPQSLSDFAGALPSQMVQHQVVLENFTSLVDLAVSMAFALGAADMEAMRDAARHVIIRTTLTGTGAGRARW